MARRSATDADADHAVVSFTCPAILSRSAPRSPAASSASTRSNMRTCSGVHSGQSWPGFGPCRQRCAVANRIAWFISSWLTCQQRRSRVAQLPERRHLLKLQCGGKPRSAIAARSSVAAWSERCPVDLDPVIVFARRLTQSHFSKRTRALVSAAAAGPGLMIRVPLRFASDMPRVAGARRTPSSICSGARRAPARRLVAIRSTLQAPARRSLRRPYGCAQQQPALVPAGITDSTPSRRPEPPAQAPIPAAVADAGTGHRPSADEDAWSLREDFGTGISAGDARGRLRNFEKCLCAGQRRKLDYLEIVRTITGRGSRAPYDKHPITGSMISVRSSLSTGDMCRAPQCGQSSSHVQAHSSSQSRLQRAQI